MYAVVQGNEKRLTKSLARMIRKTSPQQQSLNGFDWPFDIALDSDNRWIKLSKVIPWQEFSAAYERNLNSRHGRPALDARMVIGAVIIKHKLILSDRETVAQIQENPYLQYFVGLKGFTLEKPFDASLFVKIRRRMGAEVFDAFTQSIVDEISDEKAQTRASHTNVSKDEDSQSDSVESDTQVSENETLAQSPRQGKLLLDATVAEQAIAYPTDVNLLNGAREFCEQIIDLLHENLLRRPSQNDINNDQTEEEKRDKKSKKPRTYREKARSDYLSFAKRRKPSKKLIRKAIRQQLQYIRRDLKHIETLLEQYEEATRLPLPTWLLRRYWVIPHLYEQQKKMYEERVNRCDDRIVSIDQPWVRPIVRGKQHKAVEFGAKLGVSMSGEGIASVDHCSWDAYNEGQDLIEQVEAYAERYGYYPQVVLADPAYGTRKNRAYLKDKGIRFGGKPLGRPRKQTSENEAQLKAEKKQRQEDYRSRIPIEGKFGQGKGGYRLNYIRAKRADTSEAWINGIFLVMNLLVLYGIIFWTLYWPLRAPMRVLKSSMLGAAAMKYHRWCKGNFVLSYSATR